MALILVLVPVTLIVVLLAAREDLVRRRVSNRLTLPAAAAGLVLHTYASGWDGLLTSLAGLILGSLAFILFYFLGGLGAGDVKLLGAVGALLGPGLIYPVLIHTALAGGILGLLYFVRLRARSRILERGAQAFLRFLSFGGSSSSVNASATPDAFTDPQGVRVPLPYAVAVAFGTLTTLCTERLL